MRDAPHLNASAIILQAIFQPPLDRAVVALLVHVDEVDYNQSGQIAQTQLPCYLLRGFQVSLERSVFNVVFARGAPGIDVNRNQRLGLIEHDVAAGLELYRWREHGVELAFDSITSEDWLAVAIRLHVLRMT